MCPIAREETCVENSNQPNKFFPHFQFSISSANPKNFKWTNQMIINKENKSTKAVCHAKTVSTAWSESATHLCCKKPYKEQLRKCGDSVAQFVLKALLMTTTYLGCLETNCFYFNTQEWSVAFSAITILFMLGLSVLTQWVTVGKEM